jgi:phenylalanyl-tRNA synthetase alpha chain
VLRTHTSAHQADTFRANETPGFLISADVYRRDAVDRSHYPVFHQMEGAMTWDRNSVPPNSTLAEQIRADVAKLPKIPSDEISVEDPNPTIHAERNPLQATHSAEEVEAIAAHLKRSLEDVVVAIFTAARATIAPQWNALPQEPLKVRWVEAYFPFTSPSWELEVLWQGEWLEVLGCGVVKHSILDNAHVPSRLGWAFGLGLERIAMLLFSIPDIRLFWSQDPRFLLQFGENKPKARFTPYSKYPACFKDVSFWLPNAASNSAGGQVASASAFHENDVMELVRDVAGDLAEDVKLVDEFTHPKSGRRSLCYRVNYRSFERTLSNEETNDLHEKLRAKLVERLGVELR